MEGRVMPVNVAVVILTLNEEENIGQCLRSVCGWARDVYVVDSYSVDATTSIAEDFGCKVVRHRFENYALQRNWALDNLPISTEWILFLDADEWLPENVKAEISSVIAGNPQENGFYMKWRFIWMGRWIRRGYYPTWILRLMRKGKGRFEERGINEHLVLEGPVGFLENDFVHEDRRGIRDWIDKHNRYATLEAQELIRKTTDGQIAASLWGSQAERKRWLRHRVYNRLPPLVRPFLYFFYRYVIRGGFLDGKEAFIYHFLQGLWFYFLIDARYLEMKRCAVGSAR